MGRQCKGDHDHVQLLGGKAHAAERYPPELVAALLGGMRRQLVRDGVLDAEGAEGAPVVCQDNSEALLQPIFDDLSGRELNEDAVREARQEELETFRTMDVYSKVPVSECTHVTGKGR